MNDRKPTYEELERRCREAEARARRLAEAEEREGHIKQVLLAIRNVNQLIVKEDDPKRLIERACENLTETLGYHNAWIALLDEVDATTAPADEGEDAPCAGPAMTASSGFDGAFSALRKRLARREFPDCMRSALERDEMIVVDDPKATCPDCPLSSEYGGRTGFCRRLSFGGRTYGILAVSVPGAYAREEEEQSLFDEVADDLSFALHKIETARRMSENTQYLRTVLRTTVEGFWVLDRHGRLIEANDAFCEMTGYARDELTGMSVNDFDADETPEETAERARRIVANGSERFETRMRRKDGRVFPVDVSTTWVDTEGGRFVCFGRDMTERQLWLRRLALLGRMLDAAPASITIHDTDGRFFFANRETLELHGYERLDDFLEVNLHDLDVPETEALLGERFRRIAEEGEDRFEVQHRRRDGSTFPLEVLAKAIEWEGRPAVLSIATDISERRRMEEQLRESEQRYRNLFENAQDAFYEVTFEGEIVDISPSIRNLSRGQYRREDLIGKRLSDFYAIPDEREAFLAAIREKGAVSDYGIRLRNRDGSVVECSVSAKIQLDAQGQPDRIIGSMRDITSRKEAEAAVRESEERYRALVMQSADCLILHDLDGRIVDVNPCSCRTYGYSREEMLGMKVSDLDPDYAKRAEDGAFYDRVKPDEATVFEARQRAKDGRVFPVEVRLTKVEFGGKTFIQGLCRDITERKEAEQALREGEERFRTILEGLSAGVFAHDLDGRLVIVNEAACRNTGYTREELIGMTVGDIDPASVTRDDRARLWMNLSTGQSVSVESTHIRKDGSEYPAEIQLTAVTIDGEPVILGAASDITERKQAEQALREAAVRQREAVRAADVGLWDWDLATNRVHYSAEWKRQIGYEEDEIGDSYREWESRVHPDDLGPTSARVRRAIEEAHQAYDVEFRFRHKDGSYRWIFARASVFKDESGRAARLVGSHVDITERKKTEEALRTSEERFQRVLAVVPDMISIHDCDMNILYSNWQGFANVPEERRRIGDKCHRVYRGLDEVCPDCQAGKVIRTRAPIRSEESLPEGMWVDLRVIPLLDRNGEVEMFMEWVRDITEEKKTEMERAELEEQYRQAQKLEAIGQLTGGVAHDFNNLLQVINSGSMLALEDLEPGHPARETLGEVVRAGERAAGLVAQLLLFSRRQIMRPVSLDLDAAIGDLLKMIRRVIGEHIRVAWVPGGNLGAVLADRGMVEQALMNLCVNARDAMAGGGSLTIETQDVFIGADFCAVHTWARPGHYAVVSVTDTGCGMDDETLEHIFEPFFTTKERGKGTGLGLATVYGVVKQHNGLINVISAPGEGTTFQLYWPVSEVETPQPEKTPQMEMAGGSETILLAEDDESVRALASRILERAGYTVLTAANGAEAVDLFERRGAGIDLAVLDVVMPEMSGREAFDRIRALRPEARAVFASGYSEDAIHTDFVLEKGLVLIQKPFHPSDLLREVRRALDRP